MLSFIKRHSGFFLLLAGIAGLVVLNLSQTASAREAETVSATTSGAPADTSPAASTTPAFVFVDVRGEVYAPGVYRVPSGTRVVDVIGMAGGPTRNADLDALNQAKVVVDEMVVFVPSLLAAEPEGPVSWIWVDVKGAVVSPGVYCLEEGARGADAVASAGGLLDSADVESVNLSALLADATVLFIPFREDPEEGGPLTAIPGYGYVAVKGEVLHPGLYYVSTEATVGDVIALAGGTTLAGSVQNLDLAESVVPGSTIRVLSETEVFALLQTGTVTTTAAGGSTLSTRHLVNINTATVEELDTLYGIGPVIAQNIIDYRAENGFFERIEDLVNVSGIGASVYEAIKDDITI